MADSGPADQIRAAGAVLWRLAGNGVEVGLVHRPKYDDWSFAKGKLSPGEHVLLAAVREVGEETGLRISLGRRLPSVHYRVDGLPKVVDYWTAQVTDASGEFAANSEVDALDWVTAEQAGHRLSYGHDVELLEQCVAGPLRTMPLILVRHASAGSKSGWHKDDMARPLDERGRHQAATLTTLLRCFGDSRVLSSPAERCMATVRPFAAAAGQQVAAEPAFAVPEATAKKSVRKAAAQAAACAAANAAAEDRPVVICAHRENLPLILESVCDRLGADTPPGPPLHKAGFWVLHRGNGRLIGAERHHPEDEG